MIMTAFEMDARRADIKEGEITGFNRGIEQGFFRRSQTKSSGNGFSVKEYGLISKSNTYDVFALSAIF